ncbi:MAG: DUF1549 and DUF1553 domain-containing protein [Gemmataceae bacterium]
MPRLRLLLSAAALLLGAPAWARPPYQQALLDLFGTSLPTKPRDCRTCHLAPKPEEDAAHNAFGARLKALRAELRKAGKKTDITARLLAALDEDSDRDGVANGVELFAGTAPGDPADKPNEAAVTVAKQELARWLAARGDAYAWQPFEPARRPPVPAAGRGWARNPVDAFLAAGHAKLDLRPRPEAPKHVLLRRVYLDLIGLPPSREQLRAFLADPSPDAYEKVVEHLLSSPLHGERWGRHWMDVWRYADWAGYGAEVRDSKKHIWHWRDWIVESLNQDKPYDRMVHEMLAADELAPADPGALRATGFLVRNWYLFNRNVWLDRIVEHTGKAFLGVTLNCARCHDHFYDPLTMRDYYAFRAIFEPHDVRTDRVPGVADVNLDGLPRVYDASPGVPTYVFERGDPASSDRTKVIAPGVPEALGGAFRPTPVPLPRVAWDHDRRPLAVRESKKYPVPPGMVFPATSSGRRLALARWITDRDNPLAARVLVNHAWQRHFGKALVPSEFDFGRNGQRPTHPALVDWLAAEFVEGGWSMKALHRLMVTSAAYRMDSTADGAMLARDPDNRLLWRMNSRRMEGEAIRDTLLSLAGQLDLTMGGPDIDHKLGLTVGRRSVYFQHAAEKQMEFLLTFDAASVNECYRRTESVVPQQALALANSTLAVAMSRRLAGRLAREGDFVGAAFEHVLGRAPTGRERQECEAFLKEQAALLAEPAKLTAFASGSGGEVPASPDAAQRARESLVHALFNLHELVTIR